MSNDENEVAGSRAAMWNRPHDTPSGGGSSCYKGHPGLEKVRCHVARGFDVPERGDSMSHEARDPSSSDRPRVPGFADNTRQSSAASRYRRRRVEMLNSLLGDGGRPVRLLDIGGTPGFWDHHFDALSCPVELVLINRQGALGGVRPGIRAVIGDATCLTEFRDGSFDVVFSNSVIEHVGTLNDQMRMAGEVRRLGRAYLVQTPNRWFPIEPHFLFPGWQFMPIMLRTWLIRRRGFGWMSRIPDPLSARAEIEQIRLLQYWEMKALFPDARVVRERFGPLTKSLIAIKHRDHATVE